MVIFPKDDKPVDHRADQWCHRHRLRLDNIDNPTERDKRLIESIRYKIIKQEQRDGTIKIMKVCPRCSAIITVDIIKRPLLAQ